MTLTERPDQAVSEAEAESPAAGDICHPMFRPAPSTVQFNKVRKRFLRHVRQAIDDFGMVAASGERPRWLVVCPAARTRTGC